MFIALGKAIRFSAKQMAKFSVASLMTVRGIKSLALLVAKGGALFVAFKGIDKLFELLKSYPGADILIGFFEKMAKDCPTPGLFYPPTDDFMKSFSVDVCDPTFQLTLPKIVIPSLNFKYKLTEMFKKRLEDALQKIIADIMTKLILGSLNGLESALCKAIEAVGAFTVDALTGGNDSFNAFLDALDEAFCNGETDEDGRSRAEKLAEQLFGANSDDYVGIGNKASSVISGVASQQELLSELVSEEGEGNTDLHEIISQAVNALAPEISAILGSPNQVAIFFRNLSSYLSEDDKDRIRALLDSGVPNIPISNAICLTDDELNEWNNLRQELLRGQGLSEEDARARVDKLNSDALAALESALDDVANLADESGTGPFNDVLDHIINGDGADTRNQLPEEATIDDVYGNTESCNDNVHPINQTTTPQVREFQKKIRDQEYANVENDLKNKMLGSSGIIGEAMRDTNNNNIFLHGLNVFFSGLYDWIPGTKAYVNDPAEYDGSNQTTGRFPLTVGLKLREDILSKISYDQIALDSFSSQGVKTVDSIFFYVDSYDISPVDVIPGKNITYSFETGEDVFRYNFDVSATQTLTDNDGLDYRLNITELLGKDETEQLRYSYNVPIEIDVELQDYLYTIGYPLETASSDLFKRKSIFEALVKFKNPGINDDELSGVYQNVFQYFNTAVLNEIFTNPGETNGVPIGFQFGYEPEDLEPESFEYFNPGTSDPYDKKESEKILGEYNHSRIIVLNPEIYGGRYSNPPIYIEPRKFSGWYDIKDRLFTSEQEGCEPKTPPLLNFKQIKDRVSKLEDEIKMDPRLAEDPDCTEVKPFGHLIASTTAASLDGVVRKTLRLYIIEHFLSAFGLLSNVEYRSDNFDAAFSQYILATMKEDMLDLGFALPTERTNLTQKNYYYTFLEQCVEAYQRMIDLDGIAVPEEVEAARSYLGDAVDLYEYPTKKVKDLYVAGDVEFDLPGKVPDLKEAVEDKNTFYRHAMAYRYYGDTMFESNSSVKLFLPSTYSLKKIRFFSKIYFLRLAEEKASVILSELVNSELRLMAKNYSAAPTTKPYIFDIKRHVFGMTNLFAGTSAKLGIRQYYIDKQAGTAETGDVPDFKTPAELADDLELNDNNPKLVLEKYIRLVDKPIRDSSTGAPINDPTVSNVPDFIANRSGLRDKVSLSEFSDFLIDNSSLMGTEKLSDCFGDLAFNDPADPDLGVTGSLGVFFGLQVSIVKSGTNPSTGDEEAYRINLIEAEVEAIDQNLVEFNPLYGVQSYDLECLVTKMMSLEEYDLVFDKLLNIRQVVSMAAVYSSHGFAPALGEGTGERVPPPGEDDEDQPGGNKEPDTWDKTFNKGVKDFVRLEFQSYYLSNDLDGEVPLDNPPGDAALALLNPFNAFSLSFGLGLAIPWFRRLRIKTKVYDKNGLECADPLKDLQ